MKNRNLIAVCAVAAAVLVLLFSGMKLPSKDYYAISTTSNQFIVGNLSRAPFSKFFRLDKPFILTNVQDEKTQTTTPQLFDLSVRSYWLPKSMYVNVDNVVFKGRVSPDSAIALKLKEYNEGKNNPAPSPAPDPAPAPTPAK